MNIDNIIANSVGVDTGTFAHRAIAFYSQLQLPINLILPVGVTEINPYQSKETIECLSGFLRRFFNDRRSRVLVFGINPGRFGSGLTGIPFTDPVALENECGVRNNFPKRRELSSDFIYRVVTEWGGVDDFYSQFFLTALCPIGFLRNSSNFNFYDDRAFCDLVTPFIVDSIRSQLEFGGSTDVAIILGAGENKRYFDRINKEYKLFKRFHALEHPRFILQYKRRYAALYVEKYMKALRSAAS